MRKSLLWLGCLSLALVTSPLLAGTAPADPPPAPAVSAACPDTATGVDLALLLEQTGVPRPVPRACEHNFCTVQKDSCALTCSPCGYELACRNNTCESRCTCVC